MKLKIAAVNYALILGLIGAAAAAPARVQACVPCNAKTQGHTPLCPEQPQTALNELQDLAGHETAAPAASVPGRPAAATSALIDKFQITKIEEPADPALREFRKFVPFNLEISSAERFWTAETLKIGTGDFFAPDLLSLLSGRFNEYFELDLSISDEEAATRDGNNSKLIVTGYEPLRCGKAQGNEKNAKEAAAYFLPYTSRRAAREDGQNWDQKDIDQAAGMVEKIAADCRFTIDLITMSDTNDASVRLLAVTDTKNSEVLIMGFGRNP